jgi:hypothetical protein
MKNSKNVFNVYCDESRVENPDSAWMVIGALIIPRRLKDKIIGDIKVIRKKHPFPFEIKWTKTSSRFIEFYREIINYFISRQEMKFRCILVNKRELDYTKYHDDDRELAFFKFYYLMLKPKLLDYNHYYIFIDKKPTRDKNRARALHAFLDSHILLHKENCSIEHFQPYPSYENDLLQLADYFTGLTAYAVNTSPNKSVKFRLAEYLRKKLGMTSFLTTSLLTEEKFNIFVWRKQNERKS